MKRSKIKIQKEIEPYSDSDKEETTYDDLVIPISEEVESASHAIRKSNPSNKFFNTKLQGSARDRTIRKPQNFNPQLNKASKESVQQAALTIPDLQLLLKKCSNLKSHDGVKVIFEDRQSVNAFRDKLLKIDIPGMDTPKEIEVLDADMENSQKRYSIYLSNNEWSAINSVHSHEQLMPISQLEEHTYVIELSENSHIKTLSFTKKLMFTKRGMQDENDVPSIFENTATWNNIPRFAIITGPNGVGKSKLLKYIHERLIYRPSLIFSNSKPANTLSENEVIYITAQDLLTGTHPGNSSSDTSYFISYDIEYKKCIDELKNYFLQGGKNPSKGFPDFVKKRIEKEIVNKGVTSEEINEKYLGEMMRKSIDYKLNELRLTAPLGFLAYIFEQYEKRKSAIQIFAKGISGALVLFDHYKNLTEDALKAFYIYSKMSLDTETLDLRAFLEKIDSNENFKEWIVQDFACTQAGPAPVKIVNEILSKYGFKYIIDIKDKDDNGNKINPSLIFKRDNITITAPDLSSGETMILGMMAWQYYAQGLSATVEDTTRQLDNNVKIMLLDEPDKHLDPKLCKLFYKIVYEEFVKRHGIQVIMTTHRIDTVSLSPHENIFLIQKKQNKTSITQVHKIQAMFRMSDNLRELMDYHHKVYTESINDARFYEGIYRSLKDFCDISRDASIITGMKNSFWQINGLRLPPIRLLSKRYQLSFYSVSKTDQRGNKKGTGGCGQVIASIKQDITALENLAHEKDVDDNKIGLANQWYRTRNVFNDTRFYQSFGILDNDYDTDFNLSKEGIEEYVVRLDERHSLENYLYDPIVLCSTLTDDEITQFVSESRLSQILEEECPTNYFEKSPDNIEDEFLSVCYSIKYSLENKNYEHLQTYLDAYFKITLSKMCKFYQFRPDKIKKLKEKPVYENMNRKLKNKDNLFCDKEIIFFHNNNNYFTLSYPAEFLKVRGHDIEEFFWREKNAEKLSDKIVSKIYRNGLKYIPLDLATIFFELNDKVRKNIHAVIKPESLNKKDIELINPSQKPSFNPELALYYTVTGADPVSITPLTQLRNNKF